MTVLRDRGEAQLTFRPMTITPEHAVEHRTPRNDGARAAPRLARDSVPQSFYVGEPDIPAGMTCAEWRRQARSLPRLGFLAQVRAWQGWHQFEEGLS